MTKKFDELLKYVAHEGHLVCLTAPIAAADLADIDFPPIWREALSGPGKIADRIHTLWATVAPRLPRTAAAYAARCVALAAVRTDAHPWSLLYCFDLGKRWTARRGFSPVDNLPAIAARLPIDLAPLYTLHNGLVHIATRAGPLPVERWRLIPADKPNGGLLEVLSEGGRGFGFDIDEEPVDAYWIDADDDDEPVLKVDDPWALLDEFLAAPLEKE